MRLHGTRLPRLPARLPGPAIRIIAGLRLCRRLRQAVAVATGQFFRGLLGLDRMRGDTQLSQLGIDLWLFNVSRSIYIP
jgi:hypothetical protein